MAQRYIFGSTSSSMQDELQHQTAGEYLAKYLEQQKQKEKATDDPKNPIDSITGYTAYRIDDSENGLNTEETALDLSQHQTGTVMGGEELSLPWTYRAMLVTFRYLISHKIEAMLLGLFFFFVITIVSSMKSR